jgi:hypothetical protein
MRGARFGYHRAVSASIDDCELGNAHAQPSVSIVQFRAFRSISHRSSLAAVGPIFGVLIAGMVCAHAYELPPKSASSADNACASATAYALTHAEAEILPYIKACGENPSRTVCEATIRLMKEFAGGRTYGLTCRGSP